MIRKMMEKKEVNRGYLVVEGTSQEVASKVIELQQYKANLEEMRSACKGNKHEIMSLDIAIGKVSEALQSLGVVSIDFVSLETCGLITEVSRYLDSEEVREIIDTGIVDSYKKLMAKQIRKTEEDELRNKAVADVTRMVDGLSKEELQKLIERINEQC